MSSRFPQQAVYFDGACPVCSREITFLRRQAGAEQLQWIDVARCDNAALGQDLGREAALARFHVRREDGVLLSGAAAFVTLWRSLPGWAWLGRLMGSRPLLPLLEVAYHGFLVVRKLWRKRSNTQNACIVPNDANRLG